MAKIKGLILLTLFLSGILGACAPTLKPADINDQFKLEGQQLVLDLSAPLLYASGAVAGEVTSRFCTTSVTTEPVRCPLRPDGYTVLVLPEDSYPARLVVGRVEKPPGDGFIVMTLRGSRVSVQAELRR